LAGFAHPGHKLPDEWRDYQLAVIFGWTEDQILEQRGQWLDWLLELDHRIYPNRFRPEE